MAEAQVEKTPEQVIQERIAKRIADKKAAVDKMEADALAKVKAAGEKYNKGKNAPVFLPYADRDGKIVPALLLGSFMGEKRDENGELVLNEGREVIQEVKFNVWVFPNTSEPHRAVYKFPKDY